MLRKVVGGLVSAAVIVLMGAAPALASGGYSLFGDATRVHPGNGSRTAIQIRSIGLNGFGGIDFKIPESLTFGDIQNMGTDYNFTAASCGVGSPRFQINVGGKNAFVYIGSPPNYTGCPMNSWQSTGNLATPLSFVDTSQLPGGTFYDTFAAADVKYGGDAVTGLQVVVDQGGTFGTQTVLIDNVQLGNTTYTFNGQS